MPPDPLIGQDLGDFAVEALIGRGGMGRVYRAEQRKFGRKVALKVLAPELAEDQAVRERFLREARLAATIDHPNILPVYDAGEEAGRLYIALRLVEGEGSDLQALLDREGALRPERALAIVAQVAAALDAAHARGLVHRDVKPGNVLLAGDHAYLTDFGIAKPVAGRRELTKTGAFLGTLDYASPEQIRNEEVGAASDLYALGCVLFHSLTGHPPFDRASEYAVMQAHLSEPPPLLNERRPDLPAVLDAVIATAMAKPPDERYRSGRHLAEAAKAALSGATIAAAIPTVRPTVVDRPVQPTTVAATANTETEARSVAGGGPRWAILGRAALVVALLGGGWAFVAGFVVNPPPSPTPSVAVATGAPSPTATATATQTPAATPTPSATPTPAPTPTLSPTVAQRPPRQVLLRPEQLIMPPSELPLTGYVVGLDTRSVDPQGFGFASRFPGAAGWARQFDWETNSSDYQWLFFSVWVYPTTSASVALRAGSCDSIFSAPQPSAREIIADVIGVGAKACEYNFANGGQVFTYNTGTRNVLVHVGVAPTGTVSRTSAVNRMVSLARQQLAIIDRVSPP